MYNCNGKSDSGRVKHHIQGHDSRAHTAFVKAQLVNLNNAVCASYLEATWFLIVSVKDLNIFAINTQ